MSQQHVKGTGKQLIAMIWLKYDVVKYTSALFLVLSVNTTISNHKKV